MSPSPLAIDETVTEIVRRHIRRRQSRTLVRLYRQTGSQNKTRYVQWGIYFLTYVQ